MLKVSVDAIDVGGAAIGPRIAESAGSSHGQEAIQIQIHTVC